MATTATAAIVPAPVAALVDRPEERQRVARLRAMMERLDAAPVREWAIKELVAAGEGRRGSLIRLHDAWRRDGELALVDKRKVRLPGKRSRWLQAYMRYTENDQRTSLGGWRRLMADFRSGMMIEGVGDWRVVWTEEYPNQPVPARCPPEWTPRGAQYCTLQRAAAGDAGRAFALAASRQGMQAALPYLLPVLRTRIGLMPGQVYEFDDKWHDVEVLYEGQPRPVRGLEFAAYDVASAMKIAYSLRPRLAQADGRRDSLKEREFRWLLAHILTDIGFHRSGCRLVVEHGTTAIRDEQERRIKAIPEYGRLISIERSGIVSEQVHAGYFKGDGGGNFRMKALTESSHRRDHDALAMLPGQAGKDPESKPESHEALVRYTMTVVKAAASLPERTRALLSLGMLTWPAYVSAYGAIQAGLADDWEHALEGWEPETRTVVEWRPSATAGEWHSIDDLLAMSEAERGAVAAFLSVHPDCKRARPMSRREAWQSGQAALVRIPVQEMPMLLMPEDSRRAHVGRDGLIRIHDRYLGRDEQLYHARIETALGYQAALPPGREVDLFINPFHPQHVWLVDPDSGRMLGMAPRYDRAARYDRDAIVRALGDRSADLASKVLPVRGRHQDEAEARAAAMARNARVLDGSLRPADDARAAAVVHHEGNEGHEGRPATDDDTSEAALADLADAY